MIEVVNPGIFTSIQDMGRTGYRHLGIPVGGFMDTETATLANKLLGNKEGAACVEFASPGPSVRFLKDTNFTITGIGLKAKLNKRAVSAARVIEAREGDLLEIGSFTGCFWGYLALGGGIGSEVVLGSRSQFRGITRHPRLFKGDRLDTASETGAEAAKNKAKKRVRIKGDQTIIKVYRGPEFSLIPEGQRHLFSGSFKVGSNSNRMAYIIDPEINIAASEILTAPVQAGTVQLTPSGRMIVLMRDAQTTGGYARILQLPATSIDLLARLAVGKPFRFLLERLQLEG